MGADHGEKVCCLRVLLGKALDAAPLGAGGNAHRRDLADDVDRLAGGASVGVGAEVACAGLVALAGVLERGEDVALGDGDVGVALVVLVVDVVGRVVLLDEVHLEHQGLVLGVDHQVVEAGDLVHHERDLGSLVLAVDVLAHAGTQVLGLADVEDLAAGILPQVAAGVGGHEVHLLGDGGGGGTG